MVKKLHRSDTVQVLRGKDRGKRSVIMAVLPTTNRVLVEGVNVVKKHIKPRRGGQTGQRISIATPLPVANVQLVCPECKKATRVGIRRTADGVDRVCKKCQSVIPKQR
jgi:large subunit ribosomal protein L24